MQRTETHKLKFGFYVIYKTLIFNNLLAHA